MLNSISPIAGSTIQATDGEIGRVRDIYFDDDRWTIRYRVATHWIEGIDWSGSEVCIQLTQDQIKTSPDYGEAAIISRDYEQQLHQMYGRKGYWD